MFSNGKKRTLKKTMKRSNKHKLHRGGAVYSFDLNDKVGGMPANVALNGTLDGDCPSGNTSELGFSNYGVKIGGKRTMSKKSMKSRKSKASKLSKSPKSPKSPKSMKSRKSMKSQKSKASKTMKRHA